MGLSGLLIEAMMKRKLKDRNSAETESYLHVILGHPQIIDIARFMHLSITNMDSRLPII